MFQNKHK